MRTSLFRVIFFMALGLFFLINTYALPTLLPVPPNLIAFDSPAGIKLFKESDHKAAFWKLMPYFTTELGLAYCGIASSSMVLNAVDITPPSTPSHAPYKIFDQQNFFTPEVLKIITPAEVNFHGATLAQITQSLKTFNIPVSMYHGRDKGMNVEQFRTQALAAVSSSNQFIIVNFCRKYIQEQGCGHFSPLAAYNKKADRFLLLDVARYKYAPVWVKTTALYKALSTGDDSGTHKSRGFIIVKKRK